MNRAILVVLTLLLVLIGTWQQWPRNESARHVPLPVELVDPATLEQERHRVEVRSPQPPAQHAWQERDSDEVRAYRDRLAFEQALRSHFHDAEAVPVPQRGAEALRLHAQVEDYERDGGLSAGEAALLKIALLQSAEAEPGQGLDQVEALLLDYLERYERRMQELVTNPPPGFVEYKDREREIVDEILAGAPVPDGLSREEYLRRRLQQERERLLTQQ